MLNIFVEFELLHCREYLSLKSRGVRVSHEENFDGHLIFGKIYSLVVKFIVVLYRQMLLIEGGFSSLITSTAVQDLDLVHTIEISSI